MKAVVELGGKQYLVEPGTIFLAEKIPVEKGGSYTTDRVLMLLDGDDVVLGKPFVEDGKVTFSVLDQTKRKKIIVQKFRPKKGYMRTRGHRQHASQLQVEVIEGAGKRDERVVDKKKKRKKAKKSEIVAKETKAEKDAEPEAAAEKPEKKPKAKAKTAKTTGKKTKAPAKKTKTGKKKAKPRKKKAEE